jgi:F-type H+-transporting ATPase subunit b
LQSLKVLMDILNQLGELVLGSVPTMVLFVLLVVLYNVLVRKPLEKTRSERRLRTSGAIERARNAMAAAEAETSVYEDKLRAARAQVMAEREARRAEWQGHRDKAVEAARLESQQKIGVARQRIQDSVTAARTQIEDATETLSEQILRAVLPKNAQGSEARPS